MKIEIINPGSPVHCNNVFADDKPTAAPKSSVCDPWGWDDDELMLLLGDKNWAKFEKGQFLFNIPTSHFKLITGQRPCKNNYELKLLSDNGLL